MSCNHPIPGTDEFYQELDRINLVTVTIDAVYIKKVKLVPIVVRYILPESGVKIKLREFKSVPEETAEILNSAFGSTKRV